MKRLAALLAPLFALAAGDLIAQVADWRSIRTPPLRDFQVQQPRRVELPNGMVVFLQEDHELPVISGTAIIRGGSREVPAGKTGLTAIYGDVWRTGGTTSRTGDDLDDFLEMRAAKVETGADDDSTSVSFDTLAEQLDPVYDIWVELLRSPAFREEKIDLAKRQMNTVISRRNDSPGAIASREATKLLWGADSPYARVAEYDTVASVNRQDLLDWHARYVHPNNILVGIVGDFDARAMEARLRRSFGSWKRGPEAPRVEIDPRPARGVFFVPKEDVTQSSITLLHPGARKDDPDYFAIQVFNEIFGGGFSGRLVNRIRTGQGLAYSVGGGIGTGYDRLGASQITMGTKSESTNQAIDALYTEIAEIRDNHVTPDELQLARESLLNSFIFMLDSKEKALNQRMLLEFYGYPADFLDRYRAGIETVNVADVNRVAKKFLRPDELALLVVGNETGFDRPLSSRGEVTILDITIPEPAAAKAASQPVASDDQGRALLRRMRDFLGGSEALASIRSVRSEADILAKTPGGDMQISQVSTVVFSTRQVHQAMKTPMGEIQMVIAGDSAFVKSPMGSQDLPSSQKKAMLENLWLDPVFLAAHTEDPAVAVSMQGTETVAGIEAAKLAVDAAGTAMTLWIDPATGRLLRTARSTMMMGQALDQVTDYLEWKNAGAVRYPAAISITTNGEPGGEGTVTRFEINPEIDDALFERE